MQQESRTETGNKRVRSAPASPEETHSAKRIDKKKMATIEEITATMITLFDTKLKTVASKDDMTEIKTELSALRTEIGLVKAENATLKNTLDEMKKREKSMIEAITKLEKNSRQNNLVFKGIKTSTSLTPEENVKNICKDMLKLQQEIKFKRVFRLDKRLDDKMIVLVECDSGNDVGSILRNAKLLKGSEISIQKDYPKELREKCSIIRKLAKNISEKNQSINVKIRDERIYIEKECFTLNNENKLINSNGELENGSINQLVGSEVIKENEVINSK
jgi:hypothetical protein